VAEWSRTGRAVLGTQRHDLLLRHLVDVRLDPELTELRDMAVDVQDR
jgi:hypothetical protein